MILVMKINIEGLKFKYSEGNLLTRYVVVRTTSP